MRASIASFQSFARSLHLSGAATLLAIAASTLASFSPGHAEEWLRQDGPFGGTVIALDENGSGAVFAERNDTVFRTTNGGAHWDDVGPATAFTFLSLDVTPGGAIWTGTSGRGVAWSLNGGATWTNDQIVNDPHSGTGATIIAIAVDPAGRILAGGYRSVNQGASFTAMTISGMAFAIDPAGNVFAGTMDGVHVSTDGGATWAPVNAGMSGERVLALVTDGATGLWAGTQAGDVWRSTDSGVTWALGGPGLPGAPIAALEVLPGSVLAAVQGGGLYRTTDAGLTWATAGAGIGAVRDLLLAGGDLWLATTGYGVFRSADGGETAATASSAMMYAPGLSDVAADAAGTLYLSSTASGVFRSTDAGGSWSAVGNGLLNLYVASVAAGAAGQAWAATWSGISTTTDGGDSWTASGFSGRHTYEIVPLGGANLVATAVGDAGVPSIHRSTDAGGSWAEVWSSPNAFQLSTSAITDDGSILIGGTSVFGGILVRSTDGGVTWTESALGTIGVEALAAGPGGLAWAATASNVVHRSTDHGVTWSPLPSGGWPTGTVSSLSAMAYTAGDLFLVGTGRVYRSTDDGDTWSGFNAGLSANVLVSFVVPSPVGVFAGTAASGIYRLAGATGAPAAPSPESSAALVVAPNPFRHSTDVSWNLPRPAVVRLLVYDVRGRQVAELSPGPQPAGAGTVTWNGIGPGGTPVAPGAYFVRWEADRRRGDAKVLRLR